MPAPATIDDFLDVVRKSNQIDTDRLVAYLEERRQTESVPPEPRKLAALLIREGLLTAFQAEQFLLGKHKGFLLGGYRLIERIGSGGTGTVYLAEHEVMKRPAALKVLPPQLANDPSVLERFRREAQASAILDHPNIVRAYDFRQEGGVNFLVMEYVAGPSLDDVMRQKGPLPVAVACEYVRQAAAGLEHAHQAGLVHRDVKPGNLLVDESGTVKLLDLGLARFQPAGQESVTKKFDENMVMGTADYLAPEQALNLHEVDHRADIYSLGATLYALLAGEPPFHAGTVTQKLLWHQMRDPRPLRELRPDVPEAVAEVVAAMMAKDPEERLASCAEVAEALAPFCGEPTPQPGVPRGDPVGAGRTSPYARAGAVPPPSTRRHRGAHTPVAPSETLKQRREAGPAPRRGAPDVRLGPGEGGSAAGMMLLGGVMMLVLLAVGGVLAFLIWGPQPTVTATQSSDPDQEKRKPQVIPGGNQGPLVPDDRGLLGQFSDTRAGTERVAFAGDGNCVVTAGADHFVRVWDLRQRRVIHTVGGHSAALTSVAINRQGNRILSASNDGRARLCELPSGREIKRFETPGKPIRCAQFTWNEAQVVTCGDDPIIRLWDVNTGKVVRELKGHSQPVNCLAIRPGKSEVLSASSDRTLRLWDLTSGKPIRSFPGAADALTACAFTPDGLKVLSGGHEGKVRLYNAENARVEHEFGEARGHLWAVAVSGDGRRGLASGQNNVIHVWDLRAKRQETALPGPEKGVTGLAFAPNNRQFVSSSKDGVLRLWELPALP